MPTNKFFTLLFCLFSAFIANCALALPSDQQATITVEADRAQLNEKTGITTYQGSVIIKQGTLLIEADQVTIYSNQGQASKIICTGKPAHYQQQPKPEDGLVNAYGNTIEYHLDAKTITLIKNASLEQQGSTLKGDHINYDLKTELVEARGNTNNQQRVHMVIPASKPATDKQTTKEQSVEQKTANEPATGDPATTEKPVAKTAHEEAATNQQKDGD